MEENIPVFSYELKNTLEQLTKLVEKLPGIIPDEIRQNAEAAFNDLVHQVNKSKKYLDAYHTELSGFQEKACSLYDEAYLKIKEKKESTDKRLEALSRLNEIKCHIPYNFTELINIAERMASLTDDQFDRLIQLAKAFGGSHE